MLCSALHCCVEDLDIEDLDLLDKERILPGHLQHAGRILMLECRQTSPWAIYNAHLDSIKTLAPLKKIGRVGPQLLTRDIINDVTDHNSRVGKRWNHERWEEHVRACWVQKSALQVQAFEQEVFPCGPKEEYHIVGADCCACCRAKPSTYHP
jgi:hypothetical protein